MPSTARSKHVYLVVSDYVANTLLYSAKEKGLARQTFSAEDDPTIRSLLGMHPVPAALVIMRKWLMSTGNF